MPRGRGYGKRRHKGRRKGGRSVGRRLQMKVRRLRIGDRM